MADLLALQRTAGNAAVARLLAAGGGGGTVAPRKSPVAMPVQRIQYGVGQERAKGPWGQILANMSFGSKKDRKDENWQPNGALDHAQAFSVRSTDDNVLNGWYFRARPTQIGNAPGTQLNGKHVLAFSGSAGSAEKYLSAVASNYTYRGADVVIFNYRGFGGSTNVATKGKSKKSSPSERGLYDDGKKMWEYVIGTRNWRPADTFLHGYSLGGAVASHLANQLHEDGTSIGGLILHSAMPSVEEAASIGKQGFMGTVFGWGGRQGRKHVGAMSTKENLAAMATRMNAGGQNGQGPLPRIYVMSGDQTGGDQLAMGLTGLDTFSRNLGFNTRHNVAAGTGHEATGVHTSEALGGNFGRGSLDLWMAPPQGGQQAPQQAPQPAPQQVPQAQNSPPRPPRPPVPNKPLPPIPQMVAPQAQVPDQAQGNSPDAQKENDDDKVVHLG